MKKNFREVVSVIVAVMVLIGWTYFWAIQIGDVIELLEMANE
jgi:hypothetical protein